MRFKILLVVVLVSITKLSIAQTSDPIWMSVYKYCVRDNPEIKEYNPTCEWKDASALVSLQYNGANPSKIIIYSIGGHTYIIGERKRVFSDERNDMAWGVYSAKDENGLNCNLEFGMVGNQANYYTHAATIIITYSDVIFCYKLRFEKK